MNEELRTFAQALFNPVQPSSPLGEDAPLNRVVAARYGLSDEDADLFLVGEDEETLNSVAQALAGRNAPRRGSYVPSEGLNPQPQSNSLNALTRYLFDNH